MITEQMTVAGRRLEVQPTTKDVGRVKRRVETRSGTGDVLDREPTRRFSHVLARRIVLT